MTTTGEPSLRRRPMGGERRDAPPPRANVMQGRESAQAVISSVISEFAARADVFFRGLRLNEMRAWREFFAQFKPPKAWQTKFLDERMTTNFLHYRGNYSAIAAGLIVVGIISNPSILLALLCCALLLTFLFPGEESTRVVKVGERTLERPERMAAGVIGTAGILGLSGAWYVLMFHGGAGVFLCLVHSVFRPRTISSKATRASVNAQAAAGGFSIEGAQHFVEGVLGINGSRSQ